MSQGRGVVGWWQVGAPDGGFRRPLGQTRRALVGNRVCRRAIRDGFASNRSNRSQQPPDVDLFAAAMAEPAI
jgi:hypothetical protein